jgi:hypothetical protein
MTYSSGGLIQATDYNGFVSTTAGANVNATWSTGTTDAGWGQTALGTVAAGGTVTATQWASLVNTLASMGSQTNTTITARTAPTAGQTISVLAAVNTDLTNCYNNRGNAAASGAQYTTSGSSAPIAESTNSAGWTMTFTQTITFPSAAQARYFWNAGGRAQITMSKTGTSTDKDPDWNSFVSTVGTINFVGRVAGASQTIAGVSYSGTSRTGGSGSPTIATTTGWYSLTPGAAATQIFIIYEPTSPYTGDYIQVYAQVNSGSTAITFTTYWHDAGYSGAGKTNNVSAGGAVALSYYPPSTTYLTNSWGTPTLSSSVA